MEDADFSDEFCRFVQSAVPSVEVAEVLLYLFRQREGAWLPRQVVEGLPPGVRVSEADAAKHLQGLAAAGLAAAQPDGSYRYAPPGALGACVETLALAYEERPVTLIRLIYALRDRKIRSFADAFKLRKS